MVYGIGFIDEERMEDSFFEIYGSKEERGKRLKEVYFSKEFERYYIEIFDNEVL